ncbi:MAG: rod shape-determining protein MreD [Fimbriimonadales bacterium]|nr:rod shape-determining protein MreD [Fimbriimonadales bacterium]
MARKIHYDYERVQPHWLTRLILQGSWGRTLRWLLLVVLAAVAQGVWAPSLRIGIALPDFPLLVLACLALTTNPNTAAWAGFLTGLLHASMLNQTVGSLIVSRTLAATAVAYLPMVLAKRHGLSIVPAVVLLTLLAQGILYLAAPRGDAFWQATLAGMVYNIALAIPAYWLVRRIVPPEPDDDSILWNSQR